ncbi:MAG: acyl-[acyl-carrier-protein] thioesterase [Prevotella sp.]|nr:acyl-[acyl-carrier-protein] thioesterase [Prevotella sp.]
MCKEKMLDKVGRYEFVADAFHCDFRHELFLGHLGNHMLNAADFHSSDREFGMRYLNSINKTWVLSRLAIEMSEMPREGEHFFVETWVSSAMRYFTNRNFRIVSPEDKVYGYGQSIWAMIDTVTRQPYDILSVNDGAICQWIEAEKECPIEKGSRVKIDSDAKRVATINTHYSDIDVNGHVNSVKYIEHVLDLFSLDLYKDSRIERIDVAYVAESYFGDTLHLDLKEDSEKEYSCRIAKTQPDNAEETEVCRAKVRFAERNK